MHYDYNVGCWEFILASWFRERERERERERNYWMIICFSCMPPIQNWLNSGVCVSYMPWSDYLLLLKHSISLWLWYEQDLLLQPCYRKCSPKPPIFVPYFNLWELATLDGVPAARGIISGGNTKMYLQAAIQTSDKNCASRHGACVMVSP